MRFAVVGAKSYFKNNDFPLNPKDLIRHTCINERLPTLGGFWPWEFEDNGREVKIRVEGQLASTTAIMRSKLRWPGSGSLLLRKTLPCPISRREN